MSAWLCRSVPVGRVEALRLRPAALPGARGMDAPVNPDDDQHRSLPLAALRDPTHWETFAEAILSLKE